MPRPTNLRTPQTQYPARGPYTALPAPLGPLNGGPTPPSTTRPHPPGLDTLVPHTPLQGTPGPTPHRPRTVHVLKHARRATKRPRGAAPHRQRTSHGRQPAPPDLDTVPPPPPPGRPPHNPAPPYHTATPSPTRGHGTSQPTNTGKKPRHADSAPHPTGTTPGNPAHLTPAQCPPPATTRTAHRGNPTGQDSHQGAATHNKHAKPGASPSTGAQPRTVRRTSPEQ